MDAKPEVVAKLSAAVKRYRGKTALSGLDLEVHAGEVMALLGTNGAGKSTAISLLLGLNALDGGSAELFGQSPSQRSARSRIGVMLQSASLPESLKVRELLDLTQSYYPRPRSMNEVVELAGVGDILDRPYGKLSGGQQRRVQFAMALCGDPELIFLDEPTTGLDLEARQRLWQTVRDLVAGGCGVLLTTHYLEEAEALADRVTVISQGRTIAEGSVEALRARVSQRRLRAQSSIDADVARRWPGVVLAEREGPWLDLRATDAEAVLRLWLAADAGLRDLEVRRAGLGEAFTELTREFTTGAGSREEIV